MLTALSTNINTNGYLTSSSSLLSYTLYPSPIHLSRRIILCFKPIRGSITTVVPILGSINRSINRRLFPSLVLKIVITYPTPSNTTYITSSYLADLYYAQGLQRSQSATAASSIVYRRLQRSRAFLNAILFARGVLSTSAFDYSR